jgi:hypothetical protein
MRRFPNGWVGWLAEAQGKFYLTFYQPLPENVSVPPFRSLQLGQTVAEIPSETPLVVTEKGRRQRFAADGEIPYNLHRTSAAIMLNLSGKGGAFATIEYSTNPPFAFVGKQVLSPRLTLQMQNQPKDKPDEFPPWRWAVRIAAARSI